MHRFGQQSSFFAMYPLSQSSFVCQVSSLTVKGVFGGQLALTLQFWWCIVWATVEFCLPGILSLSRVLLPGILSQSSLLPGILSQSFVCHVSSLSVECVVMYPLSRFVARYPLSQSSVLSCILSQSSFVARYPPLSVEFCLPGILSQSNLLPGILSLSRVLFARYLSQSSLLPGILSHSEGVLVKASLDLAVWWCIVLGNNRVCCHVFISLSYRSVGES